jgi:hypothetical protein
MALADKPLVVERISRWQDRGHPFNEIVDLVVYAAGNGLELVPDEVPAVKQKAGFSAFFARWEPPNRRLEELEVAVATQGLAIEPSLAEFGLEVG